eukprot:119856_1
MTSAESGSCLQTSFFGNTFRMFSILRTVITVIVLILTIIIGWSAITQFIKLKNLQKTLKLLFYIAIISTIIRCICLIFVEMICFANLITLPAYFALLLALLGTLVVRLKHTFENTVYAIPNWKMIIFSLLFLLIIILSVIASIYYGIAIIEESNTEMDRLSVAITQASTFAASAIFIYMITAIWSVWEFTTNLMIFTKSNHDIDNIKLNQSQTKLIGQISKYNGLFSLAAITSLCSTIYLFIGVALAPYFHIGYWWIPLAQIITIIDCLINVISMYLQYSFAAKYYNKYCKCVSVCCRKIFINKATKSVKKEYFQSINKKIKVKTEESISESQILHDECNDVLLEE